MKKLFAFLLCIVIVCTVTGCGRIQDPHIPDGYISSEEHWDKEGFQDYTDFCMFKYDSAHSFESMTDYSKITDDEIGKLVGYFSNFQMWMEVEKRLDEYSFDESCISEGDFCFIKTKEGQSIGNSTYGPYDNYSVYFFDTETLTLYYIHTNI